MMSFGPNADKVDYGEMEDAGDADIGPGSHEDDPDSVVLNAEGSPVDSRIPVFVFCGEPIASLSQNAEQQTVHADARRRKAERVQGWFQLNVNLKCDLEVAARRLHKKRAAIRRKTKWLLATKHKRTARVTFACAVCGEVVVPPEEHFICENKLGWQKPWTARAKCGQTEQTWWRDAREVAAAWISAKQVMSPFEPFLPTLAEYPDNTTVRTRDRQRGVLHVLRMNRRRNVARFGPRRLDADTLREWLPRASFVEGNELDLSDYWYGVLGPSDAPYVRDEFEIIDLCRSTLAYMAYHQICGEYICHACSFFHAPNNLAGDKPSFCIECYPAATNALKEKAARSVQRRCTSREYMAQREARVRDAPTFLPLPSAVEVDFTCAKWQTEIGNIPTQGDTYSASEFDGLMVTVYNPLYHERAGFQPEFVVQRDPIPRPQDITLREAVHHYGEDTVNDVLQTHYVDADGMFRENDVSDVEFLCDGDKSDCDLQQDSDDADSGN